MRSAVASASSLLENCSSIAAQILCVRSPLRSIVNSCVHSVEGITGGACFVAGHHAWILARDSWWALIDLTWSGMCRDIGM